MVDLLTLNADQYADSVSVFDQNLADLNDYSDGGDRNGARSNESWHHLSQLYAGLPLKDEPSDSFLDDHRFDPLRPFNDLDAEVSALSSSTSSSSSLSATTSNDNGFHRPISRTLYGMLRTESPTLNLSRVIEWSDYFANTTKTENDKQNETETTRVEEKTATTHEQQNATENFRNVRVKLESEGDDDDQHSSSDDCKNSSTSGFSSNVELTEEVTNKQISE